ncbi:ACT domain-containing protein [Brevibacillus reuszeri]|uniref:ACT domain-containing protein n=1 Tax=Brevibacillus reuszeri TaxID=54915 RepID=UPI000CCC2A6C|nr:ACT domain-containing protein [Brevibacillus reuszeri]
MNEQTIQMMVVNHPATFLRILGVYSRRGIQIDRMSINRADQQHLSNVSITVQCDSSMIDHLSKQLEKQVDVISVFKCSDPS